MPSVDLGMASHIKKKQLELGPLNKGEREGGDMGEEGFVG